MLNHTWNSIAGDYLENDDVLKNASVKQSSHGTPKDKSKIRDACRYTVQHSFKAIATFEGVQ
jgi:hypothetical protein